MDPNPIGEEFLKSSLYRFRMYKALGNRALAQLSESDMAWSPDAESNSVRITVKHLHGNMLSRWTDFLTADGEKPTRDRDGEFEDAPLDGASAMADWEEGWACLFRAVEPLTPDDLLKRVTIRTEQLSVLDALHRQLGHIAYHVGEIVWLAKHRKGAAWQTLSIPRGRSRQFSSTGERGADYRGAPDGNPRQS